MAHELTQAVKRFREDISAKRNYNRGELDEDARAEQLALRQIEDLRDRFAKALLKTKKSFEESETNSKFSIKYDKNNTPYVEIDNDVLEGVPKSQWVKTVKKQIPLISVKLGNSEIEIKKNPSVNESLNSKYAKHKRADYMNGEDTIYPDRLNSLVQVDEIVKATRNYINEAPKHERKDNIKQFARGNVNIKIGGKDYTASSIFGYTSSGRILLYDIIDFKPTTINKKSADATIQTPDKTVSERYFTSADANLISHTDENVNTIEKNNSNKTKYSLTGSALARAKQMETEGESPFAIKEATGWYRDNKGNWKMSIKRLPCGRRQL